MHNTKSNGERLSPWNIPLLMLALLDVNSQLMPTWCQFSLSLYHTTQEKLSHNNCNTNYYIRDMLDFLFCDVAFSFDCVMNGLFWFLPISWICFYSFFLIIYSVSCCFMDEFSDDKFETLLLFMIFIFILLLRIAGIVELELLTSLKTIMFQRLTEIEWCFEMFYFFSFRS